MPDLELEVAEEVTDPTAGVEDVQESVATETDETTEQPEGEQPELSDEQPDAEAKAAKEDVEFLKQLQEKGIPPKYKELLKKEPFLRDSVMGYKAFRGEFPGGLKEAKEFRDVVTEVGGREGIESLKADAGVINNLDELISNGSPEAIDAIIQTSPEGFVKLMPAALEKFREADGEMYNHVLGRVVFNTIKDSAVVDAYHALVKAGDTESAKKLAEFYNNLEALAAKQPEKKIDPERKKFEDEKTQFAEQQKQEFVKGVSGEMRIFNLKTMETELAKQFKAAGRDYAEFKKKNPDNVIAMLEKANNSLLSQMEKDQNFVKQHNALLERKDRSKVLSMTQARSGGLIPEVAKKVYRLFHAGAAPITKKAPAAGTGKPPAAGTIRLSKAPEGAKIDYQRTTTDMIFDNTAYLLGRKEKFIW